MKIAIPVLAVAFLPGCAALGDAPVEPREPLGVRTLVQGAAGLAELGPGPAAALERLKEKARGLLRRHVGPCNTLLETLDSIEPDNLMPHAVVMLDFRQGKEGSPFVLSLRVYDLSKEIASAETSTSVHAMPLVFSDFEEIAQAPGDAFPDCEVALGNLIDSLVDSPRFRGYAERLPKPDDMDPKAIRADAMRPPGELIDREFYEWLGLDLRGEHMEPSWVQRHVLFPPMPAGNP